MPDEAEFQSGDQEEKIYDDLCSIKRSSDSQVPLSCDCPRCLVLMLSTAWILLNIDIDLLFICFFFMCVLCEIYFYS